VWLPVLGRQEHPPLNENLTILHEEREHIMAPNNQENGPTNKKFFRLELAKTIVSALLLLTVFFAYLQWRATIKNEAANRFLDIIDKLGNLHCDSVRAGAVITMAAHLRENYEEYRNQSIPVLVAHLTIEPAPPVRTKIVNILTSKEVEPDDVIKPLISEIRDLTRKNGDNSSPRLLDFLVRGEEAHENLLDMSKALVSLLQKKPPEESDLSGYFLMDWSPRRSNWEQANLEGACLLRVSLKQANLREADLRGAEFYDANLTGAFLQQANLSRASLREVILKDAELSGAILEWANLVSTDLRQANLTNAKLMHAILTSADMVEATLHNADLFAAELEGAELGGADLTKANLTSANLASANLTDANLTEANLTNANLTYANLTCAILDGASLDRTSLRGANLTNAVLRNAALEEAIIDGAMLERADLSEANLARAILKGADLEDVNLEGANLEGANLRAVVLFRIDSEKSQSDLNKGTISERLQQQFKDSGIYLSGNTTISIEEKDRRWLISDKDNRKTYTIRKEEEQLNICRETKFDFTGIKKAKNWDKAIFDDDVRDKLSGLQD